MHGGNRTAQHRALHLPALHRQHWTGSHSCLLGIGWELHTQEALWLTNFL